MKKRISKICSILTVSALLAVSVTAYAESDDIEAGFQAEEETDVQTQMETQEFQTETGSLESETEQKKEENGLDTFLYVREKENAAGDDTEEKITVRKVTLDELKEEVKEDKKPELTAVVFQFATDEQEESETEEQTETQQETETQTEKTETEKETEETKEKYPTVELSDLQKEIVYEVAELVPQTVVLLNQCEVEDTLMFKEYKQVKAVTVVKATGEKELEKTIEKYDLEKEYTSYLKLQAVEKAASAKSQTRTSALTQTETTKSLSQMPQTESQTTSTPSNRAAGSSSSTSGSDSTSSTLGSSTTSGSTSTSGNTSSSGTTTTGAKDVTITFEPDEVYSGEESVSASYSVSSTKEVTYGKVTVTYDTNIMKFDDVNAEDSDALEGMTVKVTKPTDSGGTDGKIVIEFSSTTPKKLEGTLVDLWFNLTSNATTGQQFNISMTVDELRNGSTNLTSEVKTASMVAQADEDSETETTAQTTASTTASTTAQTTAETSAPQNAPKTGDTTNTPLMALLMAGSAAVYFCMKKGKSTSDMK